MTCKGLTSASKTQIFVRLAAVVLTILLLEGCKGSSKEETAGDFRIYVLPPEVLFEEAVDLSVAGVPEEPILTADDIVSYAAADHRMRLAPGVADRLDQAELPGKAFVVTAGGQPVYLGAFMAAFMSRSHDGVVILWPPMSQERDVLEIQLGYPGPDFFSGVDPRSDKRILGALDEAGVLR